VGTVSCGLAHWAGRGSRSGLCWRATRQEYSADSSYRCVTLGSRDWRGSPCPVCPRWCDHRGI